MFLATYLSLEPCIKKSGDFLLRFLFKFWLLKISKKRFILVLSFYNIVFWLLKASQKKTEKKRKKEKKRASSIPPSFPLPLHLDATRYSCTSPLSFLFTLNPPHFFYLPTTTNSFSYLYIANTRHL